MSDAIPSRPITVQEKDNGVLLYQDGWPMFFVSDEAAPVLIASLKARRRRLLREKRIKEGKQRNV